MCLSLHCFCYHKNATKQNDLFISIALHHKQLTFHHSIFCMSIFSKKHPISYERTLAILFLSLVFGALLMKPIHLLWVHHDIVVVHDEITKISSPTEQDCPICDFEFFLYTSETVHLLPEAALLPYQPQPVISPRKAFDSLSGVISLRAPPFWLHVA